MDQLWQATRLRSSIGEAYALSGRDESSETTNSTVSLLERVLPRLLYCSLAGVCHWKESRQMRCWQKGDTGGSMPALRA